LNDQSQSRVRFSKVPIKLNCTLRRDACLRREISLWDVRCTPIRAAKPPQLIDDRHERRSTLLTNQLPIAHWHAYLGDDPTFADALLPPLEPAHRLELKNESMRKREKSLTASESKSK
jgi:hypothetical protein